MLLSLALVAATYLGGIASLTGGAAVAGALATGGVVTVATGGAESSQGQFVVTGLALVAATVLAPDGLRGRATVLWAWAEGGAASGRPRRNTVAPNAAADGGHGAGAGRGDDGDRDVSDRDVSDRDVTGRVAAVVGDACRGTGGVVTAATGGADHRVATDAVGEEAAAPDGDVLLDVRSLTVTYGGVTALADVDLTRGRRRGRRPHRAQRRRQDDLHRRHRPAS